MLPVLTIIDEPSTLPPIDIPPVLTPGAHFSVIVSRSLSVDITNSSTLLPSMMIPSTSPYSILTSAVLVSIFIAETLAEAVAITEGLEDIFEFSWVCKGLMVWGFMALANRMGTAKKAMPTMMINAVRFSIGTP